MRPERGQHSFSGVEASHPTLEDGVLRLFIPASEWSVRCGLQSIRSGLSDTDYTPDDLSTIELVVAEILNNIVEHAYKGVSDGMIEVELLTSKHGLICTIIDDGSAMPDGELPIGAPKDLSGDLDDLPEGGFGWFLIRTLTHDLSYGRIEGRNLLSCKLKLGDSS